MIEHKKIGEKWIDGLGLCVEVLHTDEVGESYTSYTPIEKR